MEEVQIQIFKKIILKEIGYIFLNAFLPRKLNNRPKKLYENN